MDIKKSPTKEALKKHQDKDSQSQVKTIFHYLKDHVATASMASNAITN